MTTLSEIARRQIQADLDKAETDRDRLHHRLRLKLVPHFMDVWQEEVASLSNEAKSLPEAVGHIISAGCCVDQIIATIIVSMASTKADGTNPDRDALIKHHVAAINLHAQNLSERFKSGDQTMLSETRRGDEIIPFDFRDMLGKDGPGGGT